MFLRWFVVFVFFAAGLSAVFYLNFLQLQISSSFRGEYGFLGVRFSSYWVFLAFYILIFSPLILAANYLFFAGYHLAYQVWQKIFSNKMWAVHLANSLASTFILLVLTWLCFQELPAKGRLAGLALSIIAVFVSIFWK